jgi:hypothetical protein
MASEELGDCGPFAKVFVAFILLCLLWYVSAVYCSLQKNRVMLIPACYCYKSIFELINPKKGNLARLGGDLLFSNRVSPQNYQETNQRKADYQTQCTPNRPSKWAISRI